MDQKDYEKYLAHMKIEDLPELFQPIAEKVGLEKFVCVLEEFGGITVYFPLLERIMSKARDRQICEDFPRLNTGELARKYKVSDVWIRQLLKNELAKQRGGEKSD